MAIGTKDNTLIQFFSNPFPASGIAFAGNTKVLMSWIRMMKFESFNTTTLSATFTFSTFVFYGKLTDLFTSLPNSFNHIFPAVAIFTLLDLCQYTSFSLPCSQSPALPTELRRNIPSFGQKLHHLQAKTRNKASIYARLLGVSMRGISQPVSRRQGERGQAVLSQHLPQEFGHCAPNAPPLQNSRVLSLVFGQWPNP